MVKSRVSRSRIDVITNTEGDIFENDTVPNAFVNHYEMFLGLACQTSTCNSLNLFKACLNDQEALEMVREVSDKEVKDAMFSMGDDKSLGPDGFTAVFFKEAWSIIGNDVIAAVREFFRNGTILKELNHTIITLIPKVKSPSRVNDYRPISCCNVLFKCISKIIANRIKHCLKSIVSPNQSAFVPGRSITDNILLTQELMHNYHLDRGPPRCAFKVDIQKAYDTVDWNFLRMILHGFGFHETMVSWIMECVSSTSYSICINGSLHGFFKAKRVGLVKEILYLLIYLPLLWRFLLLCFKGEFKHRIVLRTTACYSSCASLMKVRLPVKYLGVPLVSSRLMVRDCNELVDKVQLCVQDWKNKALSIAGRLQLIQSVLGSKHIYWASVFTLPTSVLLNIEQILRHFLWCHGSSGKGKSKVAWEIVCLPKEEGGLGIRRLECFNLALMATHVWKLLILKESLWVKWIHEYKLKGRSFWDYPLRVVPMEPCLGARVFSRDIVRSGLTLQSKVSDIVVNGTWLWPVDMLSKYPFLSNYNTPINDDVDRLVIGGFFQKGGKRSIDQVVECINVCRVLRIKAPIMQVEKSKSGESMAKLWDLPEAVFV
ncbi:reverse transcriptase domain, reverse transcriptase zinc-binding domain protein [Tanacetum coccineum]